jgi:hypothetical protein
MFSTRRRRSACAACSDETLLFSVVKSAARVCTKVSRSRNASHWSAEPLKPFAWASSKAESPVAPASPLLPSAPVRPSAPWSPLSPLTPCSPALPTSETRWSWSERRSQPLHQLVAALPVGAVRAIGAVGSVDAVESVLAGLSDLGDACAQPTPTPPRTTSEVAPATTPTVRLLSSLRGCSFRAAGGGRGAAERTGRRAVWTTFRRLTPHTPFVPSHPRPSAGPAASGGKLHVVATADDEGPTLTNGRVGPRSMDASGQFAAA